MFHTMLVPLDGSARAERALPVAAQIARARGAKLILLQVVSDFADVGGYMLPAVATSAETIERQEFEARDYLHAVARRHEFEGVKIEARVAFGTPASAILDAIQAFNVDGVVICSHGLSGLARWALGSVAQAIVRNSSAPVLLLRQQGPALDPEDRSARAIRILVPLDGSKLAEAALEPAMMLGQVFAAGGDYELHLTRVIPYISAPTPDPLRDASQTQAHQYLDQVSERLSHASGPGTRITSSVILDLDAADVLARMTRAGELVTGLQTTDGFDVIAMATHGRTGIARLAMGSITERTLGTTVVPALVIRPQIAEAQAQPASVAAQPSEEQVGWPALM